MFMDPSSSGTTLPDVSVRGLRWAALLLTAVAVSRLASLAFYPLMDATESRYANIARVMSESGNWITPQTAPGEPFWGKPPLFAWSSAAAMKLFGVNEFSARIPSFLFAGLTVLLVFGWASALAARRGIVDRHGTGTIAATVLATSIGFFVAAGAVMTDAELVFASTWALVSFSNVVIGGATARRWRFGFFAALGLGLLAKGPVILVLVGLPILAWCVEHRRWSALRSLPWLSGSALVLAIAAPWYIAAEISTPGFLRYFFVGENLSRFLTPRWKGDLYGFTHPVPHGMVWIYFLASILPWSLIAVPAAGSMLWRARKRARPDPELSFLALASLAPLLFFTLSSHVIWTYALPPIPPFAVGLALWLTRPEARPRVLRYATVAATVVSVLLSGALVAEASRLAHDFSTREICDAWKAAQHDVPGPLRFEDKAAASLLFYSDGAARPDAGQDELVPHYDVYTTAEASRLERQPPDCERARTVIDRTPQYVLIREVGLPQHCDDDGTSRSQQVPQLPRISR
jgi:4-amino-4-deoxy-L-arabinose transferase-like glycosyltransferase